jgi:hypothetical protein
MKRLGMLLILLSVGMFAVGCGPKKTTPPKETTPAVGAGAETKTPETTPPAGETKPAGEAPAPETK